MGKYDLSQITSHHCWLEARSQDFFLEGGYFGWRGVWIRGPSPGNFLKKAPSLLSGPLWKSPLPGGLSSRLHARLHCCDLIFDIMQLQVLLNSCQNYKDYSHCQLKFKSHKLRSDLVLIPYRFQNGRRESTTKLESFGVNGSLDRARAQNEAPE